ncbi:MAG: GAP family protein [Bacteroidota bacterium]
MIEALSPSLPIALALALSPAPILALIIILMTPQAKKNVLFYMVGWYLGIIAVAIVVFVMPGINNGQTEGGRFLPMAQLSLAALFLGTAVWKWIHRPRKGDPIHTPKLFRHLDELGRFQSMFMGFALSGLNIKNIALIVAGALTIQFASAYGSIAVLSLLAFALVATGALLMVVAIYYLRRSQIDPVFARWKRWLIKHNNTILIVILIVFGSILLKKGLESIW